MSDAAVPVTRLALFLALRERGILGQNESSEGFSTKDLELLYWSEAPEALKAEMEQARATKERLARFKKGKGEK